MDCDWLEDRSGVVSPVPKPVTLVRKLSASSYDIDSLLITGVRDNTPNDEPSPCKSVETLVSPVVHIDKTSLSVSDDTLDVVKEETVQRTQPPPSIFARERSLESLHSNKVFVQSTRELSKGVSEPILNSSESGHRKVRREMTVTNTSCGILVAQYWGPQRTVKVYREPKCSLGISIVGGKVS